jgi:uncharacterized delta-60 repeat protein
MNRYAIVAAVVVAGIVVGAAGAAPGKLDPGIGNGGVVVTATAPGAGEDFQNGLAIQPDNKILVGGVSNMGAAAGGLQWRISRYTHNGALDGSFGTGGTVTSSMSSTGGDDEHLWELALQPDGKIVAAGEAVTASGGFDVALARLNADGTLDPGFGTGGKVTMAIGPGTRRDNAFQVRIDGNGKILIAGFADMGPGGGGRNFMLARYNPNGTLDGTFGSGGIVITRIAPADNRDLVTNNGMTIDAGGRIVVAGQANMGAGAGGFNFALARYTPDGSLDSSFDGDGIVTTAMGSGDNFDSVISVAIDGAGRIVAGGGADAGGFVFDAVLARYNPDGSLDPSFGTGGKVTLNVGPGNTDEDLEGVVIQPTGKILIGGSTAPTAITVDSDFMVARYNPDGTLDGSFGSGGIVLTNAAAGNGSDEIYDIAAWSDAKLIASGECDQASTGRDICVARYKTGEDE